MSSQSSCDTQHSTDVPAHGTDVDDSNVVHQDSQSNVNHAAMRDSEHMFATNAPPDHDAPATKLLSTVSGISVTETIVSHIDDLDDEDDDFWTPKGPGARPSAGVVTKPPRPNKP